MREKIFFKGACRFGVARSILERNFDSGTRLLCSYAELYKFSLYGFDGNKRQKRQVAHKELLAVSYLKSLSISSSAISSAVFKLFYMILNNSCSNTDFFFFFLSLEFF